MRLYVLAVVAAERPVRMDHRKDQYRTGGVQQLENKYPWEHRKVKAHACRFVHVDPHAINVDTVVGIIEQGKFVRPIPVQKKFTTIGQGCVPSDSLLNLGMEPI